MSKSKRLESIERALSDQFDTRPGDWAYGQIEDAAAAAWRSMISEGAFHLWVCSECKRIRYVRAKHECKGSWRQYLAVPE